LIDSREFYSHLRLSKWLVLTLGEEAVMLLQRREAVKLLLRRKKRINTEASFETERKMATPTLDEYGTNLTRLAQEVCTFFLDLLLGNAMDNALRSNW
jgi:hypothetical protein